MKLQMAAVNVSILIDAIKSLPRISLWEADVWVYRYASVIRSKNVTLIFQKDDDKKEWILYNTLYN